MLANIIFQFFLKGGPIMWPILFCAIAAVSVLGERTFWWWRESRKREPHKIPLVMSALEQSNVEGARKVAEGSEDPVIRMINDSLEHPHTSLPIALQMAAGIEIER